jgi:hypothetical protein
MSMTRMMIALGRMGEEWSKVDLSINVCKTNITHEGYKRGRLLNPEVIRGVETHTYFFK